MLRKVENDPKTDEETEDDEVCLSGKLRAKNEENKTKETRAVKQAEKNWETRKERKQSRERGAEKEMNKIKRQEEGQNKERETKN